MRVYSRRERILIGLTVPIWLLVVVFAGFMFATQPHTRTDITLWIAGVGGLGATWIALKIAATGRSTRQLDQNALDWLNGRALPPES